MAKARSTKGSGPSGGGAAGKKTTGRGQGTPSEDNSIRRTTRSNSKQAATPAQRKMNADGEIPETKRKSIKRSLALCNQSEELNETKSRGGISRPKRKATKKVVEKKAAGEESRPNGIAEEVIQQPNQEAADVVDNFVRVDDDADDPELLILEEFTTEMRRVAHEEADDELMPDLIIEARSAPRRVSAVGNEVRVADFTPGDPTWGHDGPPDVI